VIPSPTSFTFEPLFLALPVVAGYFYVRAWRRSPAPIPWWRAGLFFSGLALIASSLNSPLETISAHYLLMMHLLQNVAIADWAPPLLVIGLTPTMRRDLARAGGRAFAKITRPKLALPIWLVGWYAIHLALVYDYALENPWALNVEHGILIAIGLIFWWPVFSDSPHAPATLSRLGYVLAGFVGSVFLGLAFTFSGSAFYDFYEKAPRLWGLSPQQDQNFGGMLMTSEQALVFLAAIAYLLTKLFHEETEREHQLTEEQRRAGY
jgi:cytochrome c oxidase assembly factor CtaG